MNRRTLTPLFLLVAFVTAKPVFGYFYLQKLWKKISCSALVNKISTNESVPLQAMGLVETITRLTRQPKVFPKWSMQEGNLSIAPKDLLPEKLINEIQKEIGTITVTLTPRDLEPPFPVKGYPENVRGFNISLGSKSDDVLQISFGSSPADPSVMYVEELLASDPRTSARPGRSYQHQGKGLPALAMFEALHSLEDIARASGAKEIRTAGPTSYIGYQLYSRVNKMAPLNAEAKSFYSDVDRKYRLAKSVLPAGFRPFNAGSMTESLGNYLQEALPPFHSGILRRALASGELPSGYQFGRNSEEEPQFFYKSGSPESGVYFLNDSEPGEVIDWTRSLKKGLLWLGKKL